jgi:hypothetical protein
MTARATIVDLEKVLLNDSHRLVFNRDETDFDFKKLSAGRLISIGDTPDDHLAFMTASDFNTQSILLQPDPSCP